MWSAYNRCNRCQNTLVINYIPISLSTRIRKDSIKSRFHSDIIIRKLFVDQISKIRSSICSMYTYIVLVNHISLILDLNIFKCAFTALHKRRRHSHFFNIDLYQPTFGF